VCIWFCDNVCARANGVCVCLQLCRAILSEFTKKYTAEILENDADSGAEVSSVFFSRAHARSCPPPARPLSISHSHALPASLCFSLWRMCAKSVRLCSMNVRRQQAKKRRDTAYRLLVDSQPLLQRFDFRQADGVGTSFPYSRNEKKNTEDGFGGGLELLLRQLQREGTVPKISGPGSQKRGEVSSDDGGAMLMATFPKVPPPVFMRQPLGGGSSQAHKPAADLDQPPQIPRPEGSHTPRAFGVWGLGFRVGAYFLY